MKRKSPTDPLDQFASAHGRAVATYCRGVLDGSIVASRMVIRQVQRHVDDLQRSAAGWDYHFDEARACRAIDFMQGLKLTGGEFDGQPLRLQPWQLFIVWSLFGWVRTSTGLRRFRDAFLTLGRGNGKTPLAAAIMLFLACFDQPIEPAAQIKIAATKRDQAKLCFSECNNFIDKSHALRKRVERTKWSIVWKPNGSSIGPLGKEDAKTGDGFNLHGAVIDELHAWTEELRELLEKIETALGKRRQPLLIMITTAGNDRSKLWREQYQKSSQVLRGVYDDPAHFAFIAQIDEAEGELPADDPHDPRVWVKANPNLGISVQQDAIARLSKSAQSNPADLQKLLRYHCNIRVRSKLKPIDLKLWNACGGELPDLKGRVCYGGIDLGWRDDLASFYLAFPLDDGRIALRGTSWICEETPRDLQAEPWRTWIRQGVLKVTPGDVTDPESIYAEVKRCRKLYRLQTVAIDPANAMAVGVHLVNDLSIETYHFHQSTKKYNEPVRIMLDLIRDGKLLHGGDGLLTWAADNMSLKSDAAGLWMPDKQSSDEKIDPLVASIMAISESLYAKRKPDGYNQRGLRRLRSK